MQILALSPWRPWPADNGSKLRIYHLLRGLGHNNTLDLLSFCPNMPVKEAEQHLRTICRDVSLLPASPFTERRLARLLGLFSSQPRSLVSNFSSAFAELVRRQLATRHYDVVLTLQMHMAPYALLAEGIPRVLEELELTSLYEQYACETRPARRLRYWLTWWKARRYARGLLRAFTTTTVVSEAERALVAQHVMRDAPIVVIPNGVDLAGCAGDFGPPESGALIYPGALSYDANFDAVAYYLRAIHPQIMDARPDARLRVTGRVTPEQTAALPHGQEIEFTGYLADVRPAIARAWAEVVPLRLGGGTRLKVLEALALGTPVVSTSKGVEGLDLKHGREVLVADTPEDFAAQTVLLLNSGTLRQELAERGRNAAARYDWSHSVQRLEHVLEEASESARATQGHANIYHVAP
jgi:glycosyltransferase involved in cell wall biosynthesis